MDSVHFFTEKTQGAWIFLLTAALSNYKLRASLNGYIAQLVRAQHS
jgi:hypothetical protein